MRHHHYISKNVLSSPEFQGLVAEKILKDLEESGELESRLEWESRIWKDFIEKVADPGEAKFQKKLVSLFHEMGREVLGNMPSGKAVVKADEGDIEHWMFSGKDWTKRFEKDGRDVIEGVMVTAGSRAMSLLPVVGVGFDVENPAVQELLRERSIKFAREVVGTTETHIRSLLADGISAGESIPDLRKRIEGYFFGDPIPKRAEMIARTETIWASNAGAENAYVQSGVVEGKEWLIADDERTCPYCRKMDEKFGEQNGIELGKSFAELGDVITAYDDELKKDVRYEITYEDVNWPPLHPRCRCTVVGKVTEKVPDFVRDLDASGDVPDGFKREFTPGEPLDAAKIDRLRDEISSTEKVKWSSRDREILDKFALGNVDLSRSEINHLDNLIRRHSLSKNRILYRGVHGDYAKSVLGKKVGELLIFDGITSNTAYQPMAEWYAGRWGGEGAVFVQKVQKGSSAMFISQEGVEVEFLFPRNKKFKVVGKKGRYIFTEEEKEIIDNE